MRVFRLDYDGKQLDFYYGAKPNFQPTTSKALLDIKAIYVNSQALDLHYFTSQVN